MVSVIIEKKAACVMTEKDYNKMTETKRKYIKRNK